MATSFMVEAGLTKRSAFINALLPLPLRGMVTADNASLLILFAFKALSILAEGSGLAVTLLAVAQASKHSAVIVREGCCCVTADVLPDVLRFKAALKNDLNTIVIP